MNELLQNIIVLLIVGLAVAFLGWRLYKTFMCDKGACGGCGLSSHCMKSTLAMQKAESKISDSERR